MQKVKDKGEQKLVEEVVQNVMQKVIQKVMQSWRMISFFFVVTSYLRLSARLFDELYFLRSA